MAQNPQIRTLDLSSELHLQVEFCKVPKALEGMILSLLKYAL